MKREQMIQKAVVWGDGRESRELGSSPRPATCHLPTMSVERKSHQLSAFPGLKKVVIYFTDRERARSQALGAANVFSGQDWAGWKPGARNSTRSPTWTAGTQLLEPPRACMSTQLGSRGGAGKRAQASNVGHGCLNC